MINRSFCEYWEFDAHNLTHKSYVVVCKRTNNFSIGGHNMASARIKGNKKTPKSEKSESESGVLFSNADVSVFFSRKGLLIGLIRTRPKANSRYCALLDNILESPDDAVVYRDYIHAEWYVRRKPFPLDELLRKILLIRKGEM